MRWAMKNRNALLALAIAAWWICVNLPWLSVGEEQFTGSQVLPILNLLPAIALMALFISIYRKFRRTLLVAIVAVIGWALYLSVTSELSQSAVVIAELERISGILNPESHQAGVAIVELSGKFLAIALNLIAIATTFFTFRDQPKVAVEDKSEERVEDNRSLWDEQN